MFKTESFDSRVSPTARDEMEGTYTTEPRYRGGGCNMSPKYAPSCIQCISEGSFEIAVPILNISTPTFLSVIAITTLHLDSGNYLF
jgi:hypothetical protein